VWISPRDLQPQLIELIRRYRLEGRIDFFTARYQGPGNNQALVRQCWGLETIQQRYAEFIAVYQGKLDHYRQRQAKREAIPENECFREEIQLVHEYRKFLFIDPGLPDELLPEQWLGRDAAHLLHEYYRQVSPAAHRFFERVFVAYPDSKAEKTRPYSRPISPDPFAEELRRHRLGLSAMPG
jgi:phenylacetic acid degradation operon negative regulatory protein